MVFYEQGYEVEFRNPDQTLTGFASELTSVTYYYEDGTCLLTFEDKLLPAFWRTMYLKTF